MSDTPRNFPQKVDFLFIGHAYYNGKGKMAIVATIVAMLRTSPWLGTAWIDTHFEKPLVLCSHGGGVLCYWCHGRALRCLINQKKSVCQTNKTNHLLEVQVLPFETMNLWAEALHVNEIFNTRGCFMKVRHDCFTEGYIFIALQVLKTAYCPCLGS